MRGKPSSRSVPCIIAAIATGRAFSVERGVGASKEVFSRVSWLQFHDPDGYRRGLGRPGESDVDEIEGAVSRWCY